MKYLLIILCIICFILLLYDFLTEKIEDKISDTFKGSARTLKITAQTTVPRWKKMFCKYYIFTNPKIYEVFSNGNMKECKWDNTWIERKANDR